MGKAIDPGSRASRLLAVLRSTPDEAWEITALAEVVGLEANLAAQSLASAVRHPAEGSPWRQVQRLSRGTWIYRSEPVTKAAGWDPLGDDGPDMTVLRGPDGRLWVARPLTGGSPAGVDDCRSSSRPI